jgi:Fe-S-cluster containining protein
MPADRITKVRRPELVAGPHPDDPETWLVFQPRTGNLYEVSALVWRIAECLDGQADVRAVAERTGALVQQVRQVVKDLQGLGLLVEKAQADLPTPVPDPQWVRAPLPADFELVIHPEAAFTCLGVGTCCERGYVIGVRGEQVEPLRAAARALLGEAAPDPVMLWPAESGAGWGYVLDNDRGCPFLGQDHGCRIHGSAAHPDACSVFPMTYALVGRRLVVGVNHRCGCGAGGIGPRLWDRVDEVKRRLTCSPHLPVVPPVVWVDEASTISGEAAAELMMQAALQPWPLHEPETPWRMLRHVVLGLLEATGRAEAPSVGVPAYISALRVRLAGATDELEVAALLLARTPKDTDKNRRRLAEVGIDEGTCTPAEERARYVRDHLFTLRPFQQATLTQALLAVALCVDALEEGSPGFIETRSRIMVWDDVFPQDELRKVLAEAPAAEARRLERLFAMLPE